jgi:NitT/TauT family transport system substrate-binding protein
MEIELKHRTLKSILLTLAASVAISSLAAVAAAQAPLQPVKIAVGGTSVLDISYYFLLLPGPLGYWEKEGYKVDVFPISGSSESAQQLAVNNLDFSEMSASVIIQANTEQSVPLRALITNFTLGWGIAVKRDGPIKTIADLKGKKVGIVSLASGGVPLFKSLLKNNGLDPEKDAILLATGVGAQPLLALQNDQVQGLIYWSSALVGFQNANPNLEILRDSTWAKMPDFSLATSQRVINEKPKMVEGISRGIAKAMVFAAANPDCARRLQWKFYPDARQTGVDEQKAISNDLAMISVLLKEQADAAKMNIDGQVAGVSTLAMGAYQDFLFDAGILKKKVDPKNLAISDGPAFWSKVNDFDKAAIEADAKACNY